MSDETVGREIVASGDALMKLESAEMAAIAIQHRRDEKTILEAALAELEKYPRFAETAIYRKPVGRDRDNQGNLTGDMKYAEGLSVRAAEALATRYGNCAWSVGVLNETEEHVELGFVFMDYEVRRKSSIVGRVSKHRKVGGKVQLLIPEKLDQAIKAEQARMMREGVLRNMPPGLRMEYEAKAREVIATNMSQEDLPLETRVQNMLKTFSTVGLTDKDLEAIQGRSVSDFTMDDIVDLKAVWNTIKDGQETTDSLKAKIYDGEGDTGGEDEAPPLTLADTEDK